MRNLNSTYLKILSGSGAALAIKLSGLLLGFVLHAYLAKQLSINDYGVFSVFISLAAFLSILARLAIDRSIVRFLVETNDSVNWKYATGAFRWAILQTIAGSVLITIAVSIYSKISDLNSAYLMSLPLMLFTSLTLICQGATRAYGSVSAALLPEHLVKQALAILLIFTSSAIGINVNINIAILCFLLASAISLSLAIAITFKAKPTLFSVSPASYSISKWYKVSVPIFWGNLMVLGELHLVILLATKLVSIDQVAILSVIVKLTALATLSTLAVSMYISPSLTRYFREKKSEKLQRTIRIAARLSTAPMIPILLGLVFFGEDILGYFGDEYVEGHTALVVLAFGKAFTCLFGPVGALLTQTSYERKTAFTFTISVLITVIFSLILAPFFGVIGICIALSIAMITRSLWNWYTAKKHLNISAFVF